jgi:hypothetical protein
MEELVSGALAQLVEQSPSLAILAVILYRIEQRLAACIEHQEKVIDTLLNRDRS